MKIRKFFSKGTMVVFSVALAIIVASGVLAKTVLATTLNVNADFGQTREKAQEEQYKRLLSEVVGLYKDTSNGYIKNVSVETVVNYQDEIKTVSNKKYRKELGNKLHSIYQRVLIRDAVNLLYSEDALTENGADASKDLSGEISDYTLAIAKRTLDDNKKKDAFYDDAVALYENAKNIYMQERKILKLLANINTKSTNEDSLNSAYEKAKAEVEKLNDGVFKVSAENRLTKVKDYIDELAEKRKQKEEEERLKAEAEAKAKAEEEAKRKEEEERLKAEQEEADRLAKEEADRLAQEEADRLAQEEADRLAEEEAKKQEDANNNNEDNNGNNNNDDSHWNNGNNRLSDTNGKEDDD